MKTSQKHIFLYIFTLIFVKAISADQNLDAEYCYAETKTCSQSEDFDDQKLLFYDVNPPEGFNLRRDVYMRFAIMLAEARKGGKKKNWTLVLPPWYRLYHWRSQLAMSKPIPWSTFFDINSLKEYAPVSELREVFQKKSKAFEIDLLFVLKNYDDPFEGGSFVDKWEIDSDDCSYDGQFWGYTNISAKETICVRFQGKISMLWELISLHPSDKKIMFAHGEIPLHDSYGTKAYWDCRRSMKFSSKLIDLAEDFIRRHLECNEAKCKTYISVHWRRQDFARSRNNEVPSIKGTAKQIHRTIKKQTPNIRKVFIASDASMPEFEQLEIELHNLGYQVHAYIPNIKELDKYTDGGIAIIDQIICSHAAYFIGTHESTFTFRIQEEREIIGFESSTTFNRLCPEKGKCERPSKWTIVN